MDLFDVTPESHTTSAPSELATRSEERPGAAPRPRSNRAAVQRLMTYLETFRGPDTRRILGVTLLRQALAVEGRRAQRIERLATELALDDEVAGALAHLTSKTPTTTSPEARRRPLSNRGCVQILLERIPASQLVDLLSMALSYPPPQDLEPKVAAALTLLLSEIRPRSSATTAMNQAP